MGVIATGMPLSPVQWAGNMMKEKSPPEFIPEWRKVTFPSGKAFSYPTLEKANNARIMARAWGNWIKLPDNQGRPWTSVGWSGFARYLGIAKDRKGINPQTGRPFKGGLSANAGEPFYQHCARGTLPKDPTARQKLYDLAGYPWK
jgi:hypothetical protein